MDLARFNKWTQYLERGILMGMVGVFRGTFDVYAPQYYREIAQNVNFDSAKYTAAFPDVKWEKYLPRPPYTDVGFKAARNGCGCNYTRITHSQVAALNVNEFAKLMMRADTSKMCDFVANKILMRRMHSVYYHLYDAMIPETPAFWNVWYYAKT